MDSVSEGDGVPCSVFAQENEIDPVGTAGAYDIFVLVEHALPWPRDIEDLPQVAKIASQVRSGAPGSSVRLQAVLGATPPGAQRLVVIYRRLPGSFVAFDRREGRAPDEDLSALVHELLGSATRHVAPMQGNVDTVDVLLCTHGRRDRCCGSSGTRLWQSNMELPQVRMWRTSHTGGHRFAPTALVLPYGQYWAYLDESSLRSIVNKSDDPADLVRRYRGSAACTTPAEQAAERVAFVRNGWDWLSWPRRSEDIGGGRVHIHFQHPDGRSGLYEAEIQRARSVPVPVCGAAPKSWREVAYELAVTRFEEVHDTT